MDKDRLKKWAVIALIIAIIVVLVTVVIWIQLKKPRYLAYKDKDISMGFDMWALPANATIEQAMDKCDSTPGCRGFVVWDGHGIYGKKSESLTPATNQGVTAYVVNV